MTRKLLPYEYDLIDALGVSKEEYLDFVAKQHVYEDPKAGTVLDIRNEPTAVVLFVVGLLFQAASLLLAPKPSTPEGTAQTRDQRVGRRTGFNGTQELAVYGEPVPLVYTNINDNSRGGVRVSTLLLWSAVLSFGNHQFMRLMMTIGASRIRKIDPERTAIGQFPARDLVLSNVWQYFNPNGPTRYRHLERIGTTNVNDPTLEDRNDYTARLNFGGGLSNREGFSQAFSPTTADKVGVTGFIPINADVLVLTNKGDRERLTVDINLQGASAFWPNGNRRNTVRPSDAPFTLIIPDTRQNLSTDDTKGIARQDALRAASSIVDNGALFKAGSALFRVVSAEYGRGQSIETSKLTVVLQCVREGKMPRMPYGITHYLDFQAEERKAIDDEISKNAKQIERNTETIQRLQEQLDRNVVFLGLGTNSRKMTKAERARVEEQIRNNENANGRLERENSRLTTDLQRLTAESVAPFHTKGFARIEEAAYASVTRCNVLDLALRFQVYRRLSGRSSVYGTKQRDYGHSASDNGAKARTAMFAVWYRINNGNEARIPYIFCCRGFNEQDVFTYLKLFTPGNAKFIEVRLEAVVDSFIEVKTFNTKGYCYLNPRGDAVRLNSSKTGDSSLEVLFNGTLHESGDLSYPPFNKNPRDVSEFDLFNYDAYSTSSFSFDSNPEIQITAVNEQTLETWPDKLYRGLSNFALHVVSGSGTQDLRSVTAWVTEGKEVRRLEDNGTFPSQPNGSSSFAPDIFLDTIIDKDNGIGEYADLHSVDVEQLAISKRFCRVNGLYMDGAIADQRPWRQFWTEVAPFCLLELGKIGGRESLVPALPYKRSSNDNITGPIGSITRNVTISALFNQGNIIEGTLKEEFIDYGANTQDVIVTVIYRDVERNGIFPRNNSVEIKLTDTAEDNAIRETIDASQFVTNRDQAIKIAKFLCNTRRYSRRAIEFQTFPTDSLVMPGSFIYVETSNNQWDGIYTGRIEAGGVLNLPIATRIRNGQYNFLTYSGSGSNTKSFSNVTVTNNTAAGLRARAGDLFVLGQSISNKRVFRITEVNMEEEGETTIRAVEHQCNANGLSFISRGIAERVAGLFTIDGSPE